MEMGLDTEMELTLHCRHTDTMDTAQTIQRGGWCVLAVVLCAAAPPTRDTSEAHNVRHMFSMISPCTISTAKRETVLRGCAYL